MKFCKNLQRVVDISDPEWAPYWPNYKMLKKLIKELPSLVPSDDNGAADSRNAPESGRDSPSCSSSVDSNNEESQDHGDKTAEKAISSPHKPSQDHQLQQVQQQHPTHPQHPASMSRSPGEVAFFKLLHSELKKATHFFDRATEEYVIRVDRVREGMLIMKQPNSIMVNEKWSFLAKSIYRLYKDLLLLETFAIMTYCSFSKILKKHDKVTAYQTRVAFMTNVVNKANFTYYPKVLEMIRRCEELYEEVSTNLLREGKHGLYEDERLFINMIHRLNEQVLSSDDSEVNEKRKESCIRRPSASSAQTFSGSENETKVTSKLRQLVEENAINQRSASLGCQDRAQVSDIDRVEAVEDDDTDETTTSSCCKAKRPVLKSILSSPDKRQRLR